MAERRKLMSKVRYEIDDEVVVKKKLHKFWLY